MLKNIQNTLIDLFEFLKNPKDQQDPNQSLRKKEKRLLAILIIDIPIMILLSFLLGQMAKMGWVDMDNHKINELLDLLPMSVILLLAVIIIPFIEEVIFRLFLRFESNYFLRAIIAIFPKSKTPLSKIWNKFFIYIVYSSAIIFALVHYSNFDSSTNSFYFIPILVLPQFIMGLLLAYLRVRYSFILAFLLHAIHNGIFIGASFLILETSTKLPFDLETTDYTLNIKEASRSNKSFINNYGEDSLTIKNTSLRNIVAIVTNKELQLIDSDDKIKLDKNLNLEFIKTTELALNRDSIILYHLSDWYGFNIEYKQRQEEVYLIQVIDSLKFLSHSQNPNNTTEESRTIINKKAIQFENTAMEQIAIILGEHYQKLFEADDKNPVLFNINLPSNDIQELKHNLKEDYGINLLPQEREVEYAEIIFKD